MTGCPSAGATAPTAPTALTTARTTLSALVALAIVAPGLSISAAKAGDGAYYELIYDFEVAMFCGLADQRIYDAYKARRRSLEAADDRSADELTAVRIQAMAAADREYDNRSLGGHRQWCRNEGQAGVRRITADNR